MWQVHIVTGMFVLFGCSNAEELQNPRDEASIADIHEAVFRHQFTKNSSAVQQKAKAYFLSIGGKDPKAEFLKRFEGHQPPVRVGSEFKEREGLKFNITAVKWIDDNTVEVSGGYFEHGKSSSSNRYHVVRKGGKWRVEKDETLTIS